MNTTHFSIAAVERDTGISKDVLRVWERRYGFPTPNRDANGERSYPAEQVERLRLIKRLMDLGHRPGKLLATPLEELATLAPRRVTQSPVDRPGAREDLAELLLLVKRNDAANYQQAMQQRLARQGLQSFVQDTIAPLARSVGEAWEDGRIEVFEEHLFTELTKRLLRQAIAALPGGARRPRVLLTSAPDEPHALGLLMVEALLALEGAECIPLGTQMPLLEIARAAGAHRADIVALSFSAAFPQRQIPPLLHQLRAVLPTEVALWAGGGGVCRLAPVDGAALLVSLDDALRALAEWRNRQTAP
jgi:MerR family transcriptional regulator, light-induced transcriptional regulator